MNFIVYRLSIWPTGTTYGNKIQNLVYRTDETNAMNATIMNGIRLSNISRKQKILYGLLNILVPYLWAKLERYSLVNRWADYPAEDWRRTVFALMGLIEVIFKALTLLNMIVFLWNGQYPLRNIDLI
jgi:peroxin-2